MEKKWLLSVALGATLLSTGAFADEKVTEASVKEEKVEKVEKEAVEKETPSATKETVEAPKETPAVTKETVEATKETPAATKIDADIVKSLNEKLQPLFGAAPDSIKSTPVAGVYEATFDMELIYVSQDGRYFFSGDMIDGNTRHNLSEMSRSTARKVVMDEVDTSKAITFKAEGEEKHVISVFTDVSCPFCVKLHQEVPKLNKQGVTVQYFAYPRAGVGSAAYKDMVSVWCNSDPLQALTDQKNGKEVAAKECPNPVAEHFALGQKVGVTGTPAIVTEKGTMIPGYRPADQLVQALDDDASRDTN